MPQRPGWQALRQERDLLRGWLFDHALGLWWEKAGDRQAGGFFETLSHRLEPGEDPRRTRVVARQAYVYATAARMGWSGPAAAARGHAMAFLTGKCFGADGLFVSAVHPDGRVLRGDFDLYDHAFALFALAAAAGSGADHGHLAARAAGVRTRMRRGWAHHHGGFEESMPRSLPLKANPHMHMLEAALAWIEAGPPAGDAGWDELADEIAGLCLAKFLDPRTGALREFFDGDWNPVPGEAGRLVEPGHQFEWAWLLLRWGRLRGRTDAVAAAQRLVEIGESHGVDPLRGVAFNELWDDLTPRDRLARLWPQTERIKAWLAMASAAATEGERDAAFAKAAAAAAGLRRYFATDVPGLWWEYMREDGSFRDDAARTSSLYHIVCAAREMDAVR